jgi:hypothetical protein
LLGGIFFHDAFLLCGSDGKGGGDVERVRNEDETEGEGTGIGGIEVIEEVDELK